MGVKIAKGNYFRQCQAWVKIQFPLTNPLTGVQAVHLEEGTRPTPQRQQQHLEEEYRDMGGYPTICPHSPSLHGPHRRFSVQRCARCHLGISASEMVMRARDLVYHLNCFTCTTCNKMLTTGDHFGMKDSLVYCRLHFEALLQGEYPAHFNHADVAAAAAAAAAAKSAGLGSAGANPLGLPYYNGVGTVQKGRPRKRKSPGPGADLAAYNAGECKTV